MIRAHIRKNAGGEPVLTIRVTGAYDMFRLGFHLMHAQVEFCDIGLGIFRYLRRTMGRVRFAGLDEQLTGGAARTHGWDARRRGGA